PGTVRRKSLFATPPGTTTAANSVWSTSRNVRSTPNRSPLLRWWKAWTSPGSGCDELRRAAGVLDRLPRSGELYLLHALVRGEEGDPRALQFACHREMPPSARQQSAAPAQPGT